MGKLVTERVGEMDHPSTGPERVTRLPIPAIMSPSSVSADQEGYAKDEEGRNMNSRERVLAALNHREPDRVPIMDSPWAATVERWHKEGMPVVNPAEYFGYEIVRFEPDTSPRLPVQVVEETDEYIINRTAFGGLTARPQRLFHHPRDPRLPMQEQGGLGAHQAPSHTQPRACGLGRKLAGQHGGRHARPRVLRSGSWP